MELPTWTVSGTTHAPLETQRAASYGLAHVPGNLSGAKLSETFDDMLMGPIHLAGQDCRLRWHVRVIKRLDRFCVWLAALVRASSASARPMPSSAVLLDLYDDGVAAELRLPLDRLEIAFAQPLTLAPAEVVARYGAGLSDYIIRHANLRTSEDHRRVLWRAGGDRLDGGTDTELAEPRGAR